MKVICLKVGEMGTNCYLAIDEETQKTLVIDPGEEADYITSSIIENKLSPTGIVLTHGHYDHCLGSLELKLNFNIPIYLHQKDEFLYKQVHLSANHFSKIKIPKLPQIDKFLTDGEEILVGNNSLKIIHTPGHTPGSVCIYTDHNLFSGDTLFPSGPGRTDLSYSSKNDLEESLKKIRKLSPIKLYPGHEEYGLLFE